MASSRAMRKSSRMSSPMDTMFKSHVAAEKEVRLLRERDSKHGSWEEPPIRNPAPSFEDYKGLERHGVLEHMAPLGVLPGQKVKLRLKTHEKPHRLSQVRNGDVTVSKEEPDLIESTPPATTKKPEPRKPEERQTRSHPSRERDEDEDYTPKVGSKTTPVKTTQVRTPLFPGTPSSRSVTGQARLRQVVDSAVERANELGNPELGLAVKRLYDESLSNRTLADLLDAVLGQRPTPRQAADFQGYIKAARKQIKAQKGTVRNSSRKISKSTSKSPSKSARLSGINQTGTIKKTAETTAVNDSRPKTPLLQQSTSEFEGKDNGSATKEERSAKRRKRSVTESSFSSLSSLSSMDEDFALGTGADQASTARVPPPVQPMSSITAQALLGPKTNSSSAAKNTNSSNKRTISSALDDSAEEDNAKRRKLQKTFDDYAVQDSGIRTAPVAKKQTLLSFTPNLVALRTQQQRLRNGSNLKGRKDDYEDLHSPASSAPSELLIPPPAGAQSSSRAATPNHIGRPLKQIKKAARIKMSPMKKRSGVIAGIGDTGGKETTLGNGDDKGEDVNADQCSACSGNGKLLCCDGCVRSFHFTCLDPPMDPSLPPEGEWYCYKCLAKKEPSAKLTAVGVFSSLINNIDDKNPSAYHLPYDVRDFFEGVKTGEEGEYEDSVAMKSKTRAGYEEVPNNLKLQHGPNNTTILCYYCGKSSLGQREIIPCDYCDLHWHLDCLDPPLAAAPRKIINGKAKSGWMCPNHVDTELQNLHGPSTPSRTAQPVTGRSYKVRRPKHPLFRDVAMRRGFRNNGLIEILNESESESEKIISGVIYRLPENGIKLDFISRVKRANAEEDQDPRVQALKTRNLRAAARAQAQAKTKARAKAQAEALAEAEAQAQAQAASKQPLLQETFENHPFVECQAALNLTQFAQVNADLNLSSDQIENLIAALIAEAPAEVAALFPNMTQPATSQSSAPAASHITNFDRRTLELLQELIRRHLAKSDIPKVQSQEAIAEQPTAEEPKSEPETDLKLESEASKAPSP